MTLSIIKRVECACSIGNKGYNLQLFFWFTGNINPEIGFIEDLSLLKTQIESQFLSKIDHYDLAENHLHSLEDLLSTLFHEAEEFFNKDHLSLSFIQLKTLEGLELSCHQNIRVIKKVPIIQDATLLSPGIFCEGDPSQITEVSTAFASFTDWTDLKKVVQLAQKTLTGTSKFSLSYSKFSLDITAKSININYPFSFSATHNLQNPNLTKDENENCYGPCTRRHGHEFVVTLMSKTSIKNIKEDLLFLEDKCRAYRNKFHDQSLNTLLNNAELVVPSCEYFMLYLKDCFKEEVGDNLLKITLQETYNNFFTYEYQ